MKMLKRVIIDHQVITELDKEDQLSSKVKIYSRMGYKPHGSLQVSTATVRMKDKDVDCIVYTQVMIRYGWKII